MSTPLARTEAKQRGFAPLTTPFKTDEQDELHRVIADLQRGGIAHTLVAVRGGLEVWRQRDGMLGPRPGTGNEL